MACGRRKDNHVEWLLLTLDSETAPSNKKRLDAVKAFLPAPLLACG